MSDRFESELIAALAALRRYALSLCRRAEMADDLVQSAVERALARRDAWDPATRVEPWLFRILRNAWIDETRRAATRGVEVDVHEAPDILAHDGAQANESAQMLRQTQAALDALSSEQREVIELVCVEGFSYAEAADVLGIPTGTVMSRLARGRQALAQKLGIN